jgi:hypothetical protein
MNKILVFLFSLTLIFCLAGVFSKNISSQTKTTVSKTNSVDIESISFDKELIFTVCPMPSWVPEDFMKDSPCSKNHQSIKVSTKISANNENDLTYYYSVSAGKIIGNGSDVIWDLSKTYSGRYSITVGIGKDFVISGKTLTKYITIENCTCHPPCLCPTNLKITGPTKSIKEGELIIFSASVDFDDKDSSLNYDWKVSNGEIIEGLNTNQIIVKTNKKSADKKVTATLEVNNDQCTECETLEAKATVNIFNGN